MANDTFHKPTILTNEQTSEIIMGLATGSLSKSQIVRTYHIGLNVIERFESNHRFKIAEIKTELAKAREELLKTKVAEARSRILASITDKDIKKASLGVKTRSMVDLTSIKQLEEGKATQNIDIHISGMNKDDLIKFIVGEEVNRTVGGEVVNPEIERTAEEVQDSKDSK